MAITRADTTLTAAFKASIQGTFRAKHDAAGETGGIPKVGFSVTGDMSFANGTGTNQADALWVSKALTVGNSGSAVSVDLYDFASLDIGAGAGLDPLGVAVTNVELAALIIKNTGSVAITIGASAAATHFVTMFVGAGDVGGVFLPAGGVFAIAAPTDGSGWTITDTSDHIIQLETASSTTTVEVAALLRDS